MIMSRMPSPLTSPPPATDCPSWSSSNTPKIVKASSALSDEMSISAEKALVEP